MQIDTFITHILTRTSACWISDFPPPELLPRMVYEIAVVSRTLMGDLLPNKSPQLYIKLFICHFTCSFTDKALSQMLEIELRTEALFPQC